MEQQNDLFEFMKKATADMEANYKLIRKRSSKDPGTAGDQGEENWKELFEQWLPPTYKIVTKGVLINPDEKTGRQVDLLVLHPAYPKGLWNQKYYLAGGVLAAFECKATLRSENIAPALRTCAQYKEQAFRLGFSGTPHRDLYNPPIYGLLAHSHEWQGKKATPIENVNNLLVKADREFVTHPKFMIDLVCVADLATWVAAKSIDTGDLSPRSDGNSPFASHPSKMFTSYACHSKYSLSQAKEFTPIGILISSLFQLLAWEDTTIRNVAEYFIHTGLSKQSIGTQLRYWDFDIFSYPVQERLRTLTIQQLLHIATQNLWDEWSLFFYPTW
jgi:hypothetical protein